MYDRETYKLMYEDLPELLFKIMLKECMDETTDDNKAADEELILEIGERLENFTAICIGGMVEYFKTVGREHIKASEELDRRYYPKFESDFRRQWLKPPK